VDVPDGKIRRPVEPGRLERGITMIAILAALGFVPYMITYWMSRGWPVYPETYFVGLVVLPLAIFGAGRLLSFGITALRARVGRGPS
jgi:hypothetical protein